MMKISTFYAFLALISDQKTVFYEEISHFFKKLRL